LIETRIAFNVISFLQIIIENEPVKKNCNNHLLNSLKLPCFFLTGILTLISSNVLFWRNLKIRKADKHCKHNNKFIVKQNYKKNLRYDPQEREKILDRGGLFLNYKPFLQKIITVHIRLLLLFVLHSAIRRCVSKIYTTSTIASSASRSAAASWLNNLLAKHIPSIQAGQYYYLIPACDYTLSERLRHFNALRLII